MDKTNQPWVVYDAGPRHVHSPLVCLPPVCGTADVFFRQLLDLSQAGYRVISVRACIQAHYMHVYNNIYIKSTCENGSNPIMGA